MNPNNTFACPEWEVFQSAVVALAFESRKFLACMNSDSLNVILFPGSYANLGNVVTDWQVGSHLGSRTKDWRLSPVIKMKLQTINSNANTSRDLCEQLRFEVC